MLKTAGIVIINYNAGELIEKCIKSIWASDMDDYEVEVIIVDNNSQDDSLNFKEINDSRVSVILNKENKGFGFACNQAIARLNTDYILLLNPDVVLYADSLKKSFKYMNDNNEISILGALHRNEANDIAVSCSRTPTTKRIIWDIIGISKLFPDMFKPATLMSDWDHKQSRFVDQVMGAYMFIRKRDLDIVGDFDERFFVYYEDADLSYRFLKHGFKIYYNSDIEIFHLGKGTTQKISTISLFYNIRSRIQFVEKHYGSAKARLVRFLTLTIEPLTRNLKALIRLNFSAINANFKTYKMLLKDK